MNAVATGIVALLNRSNFARIVAKDVMSKNPDPLKSEARMAFNFPAKGRRGVHLEIATKYLKERVSEPNKRVWEHNSYAEIVFPELTSGQELS